ncbi:MAG: hypothetical protein Q7U04_16150 [Bacteriovorax sp.]|nr:hypothetical protein [Bacteriovorax sp.]
MLKSFYKTFLISFMSGSLMTMNMTAFAQTVAASNVKSTDTGVYSRDANGVVSKTDAHNFDAVKDEDMLSSITMIAIGGIAARMAVSYNPKPLDVLVAAAGGIAYIGAEVISTVQFKKNIEAMTIEVTTSNDGKNDQAQIDRLIDLKKSLEGAKKSIGTKKTLQTAAAAAFAAAAATAVYLSFQTEAMDEACNAAMVAAQTGLTSCTAAGEAANCLKCQTELGIYQTSFNAKNVSEKIPANTQPKSVEIKTFTQLLAKPLCALTAGVFTKTAAAGVDSACKPALSYKIAQEPVAPTATVLAAPVVNILNSILLKQNTKITNYELHQSHEINFVNRTLNFILPSAEAGWMPLLGLSASATASYLLISKQQAMSLDMLMFHPLNRAIAFGVLGGLAYAASQSSKNQLDKIDQNIAKIDNILNDLNKLQKGIQSNGVKDQALQMAAFKASQAADVPYSANATVKSDCAASVGTTNCDTLSNQVSAVSGFSNLPDSFQTIASQAAKIGDSMSGTNIVSGGTLASANSLAGKQNAIAKLLATTQGKLNEQLAGMGKAAIDFNKEQKNLLKNLNAQTAKGLKSSSMSPAGFLASSGVAPIGGVQALTSAIMKSSYVPAAGSSTGRKDKGFNLDFKEAASPEVATAAEKEGKFDIGTNDITTDSGESLFQLISNRYLKSGYPKLLEEIPLKK